MHPIKLQDWLTVRGNLATTVVTQQEELYADLLGYQDVGIYPDVSDFSGTARLELHTSPIKEDSYFQLMTSAVFTPAGTGPQTPVFVRYSSAAVPLARWVRWRLSGGSAGWSITLRVWLVGNPVKS